LFETAEATRLGDREVNQDRACVVLGDETVLLAVCDGMGGHSDGERAAQAAIDVFVKRYKDDRPSQAGWDKFMRRAVEEAHAAVVKLGAGRDFDHRPRTTCTLCVVGDAVARWAHVGDSRVYLFRGGRTFTRTRDHSAVESLFRQGQITEAQMLTHPLRNFVEQCLGGEPDLPLIEIGREQELKPGDVLLLCSDGLWSPVEESALAERLANADDLDAELNALTDLAVKESDGHSDNVTATALRWLGED
jgi:serine/threonine protein phosphatase PrpC